MSLPFLMHTSCVEVSVHSVYPHVIVKFWTVCEFLMVANYFNDDAWTEEML